MNYWKCMVLLSAVALMSMVSVSAYAQVAASHSGDTDPTTEGWTVAGVEAKGSAASGSWRVNDNGPDEGHLLYRTDTTAVEDALNDSGWLWTINTRGAEVDGPNNNQTTGKTAFSYWTENHGFYRVSLNRQQGTIREPGALDFNVEAADSFNYSVTDDPDGFHEYQFRFAGSHKSADVFVDGVKVADNVRPKFEGTPSSRVEFGAEQSGEHGDGYYSFVELRGIPEPSALALAALGCGMLGVGYRRRK